MEQVESTRSKISEFIECENAYINAKHEDFVGFSYAEYVATRRVLARRNPAAETVKAGYLTITNISILSNKKFWFVLTPETLSWYTDETKQECKYVIAFDDFFMVSDLQKSYKFVLYHTKNKNIYKEMTRLELLAASVDDLENWKKSFGRVGIFGDNLDPLLLFNGSVSKEILDTNDPNLERQIETIWVLVDSYMQIVIATLKRMIPKMITYSLVKNCVQFLDKKFVAEFFNMVNVDEVMEENEIERNRRQQLKKTYDACRTALEKLHRIALPSNEFKIYKNENWSKKVISEPPQPQRPARPAKKAATTLRQRQNSAGSVSSSSTMANVVQPTKTSATNENSSIVSRKKSAPARNSVNYGNNRIMTSQMEKARQQAESNKPTFYLNDL